MAETHIASTKLIKREPITPKIKLYCAFGNHDFLTDLELAVIIYKLSADELLNPNSKRIHICSTCKKERNH